MQLACQTRITSHAAIYQGTEFRILLFLLSRYLSHFDPLVTAMRWGTATGGKTFDAAFLRGETESGAACHARPPLAAGTLPEVQLDLSSACW